MNESQGKTVMLTHYGRKSGKPYRVKIWFVLIDGEVWLGSMDDDRSWVKNLRASGRAEVDFGDGPKPVTCRPLDGDADIDRFKAAITVKYPIMSRLLRFFFERRSCGFRTQWASRAQRPG